MNKKPVWYLQTDPRWKNKRYPCKGGDMSIGGGGCGPTSAAMIISTLTGMEVLPTETMEWCCDHGFMYAEQGTNYDYFPPQMAAYHIDCDRLSYQHCLDKNSPVRAAAERKLNEGYYLIALMKEGLWTKRGHYVVVWWQDGKVRINDPASTKYERNNGDPDLFYSQAKYFWWVDARAYDSAPGPDDKEHIDMTKQEFLDSLTEDEALQIVDKARKALRRKDVSAWAQEAVGRWQAERGPDGLSVSDGSRPRDFATREEVLVMLDRAIPE